MRPTWALSARPEPEMAALTSLGVCTPHRNPVTSANHLGESHGLRGTCHGAAVVLGEDSLHRHGIGVVGVEPLLQTVVDA